MPSKALDLITIGESLRDVFYMLDEEASVSCSLNKERCLLCLEYAEKIPVRHIVKVHAAGNSANAAVGASRLGLNTALVSWVGNDTAGQEITLALDAEGIDTEHMMADTKHGTSEATILVFQGERTQLVHFEPRSYILPPLRKTRCIYYSAMGLNHAAFDKKLHAWLKKNPKTDLVFQPGTTHIRSGLDIIKPLIRRSHLFILNLDEAHHILPDGERTPINLLESFHHIGAQNVIITDAANGAYGFDGERAWHMPVFPVKVKEPTGAGDSFATACTAALLQGEDLPTALRWGTANGWSVVQTVGPQAGLLTSKEMRRIIKRFSRIKPKELKMK